MTFTHSGSMVIRAPVRRPTKAAIRPGPARRRAPERAASAGTPLPRRRGPSRRARQPASVSRVVTVTASVTGMAEVDPQHQQGEDGGPSGAHPLRVPQPVADGEEEGREAPAEVEEPHVEHEVVEEREGEHGEESRFGIDRPQGPARRERQQEDVDGEHDLLRHRHRHEPQDPRHQEEDEPVGQRLPVGQVVLAQQTGPGEIVLAQDEGQRLMAGPVLGGGEGEQPDRQRWRTSRVQKRRVSREGRGTEGWYCSGSYPTPLHPMSSPQDPSPP